MYALDMNSSWPWWLYSEAWDWCFCFNRQSKVFWWKHGECRGDYLNPGSKTTTKRLWTETAIQIRRPTTSLQRDKTSFFPSSTKQNYVKHFHFYTTVHHSPVSEGFPGGKFSERLRSLRVWTISSLSAHHLWRLKKSCNYHVAFIMKVLSHCITSMTIIL